MSKKTIEYCMCDICQKEGAQSYRALAYRTFDATEGRYFYRKPQFETTCIDLCDDCASRVTALHSIGVMCNKFEIRPLLTCGWIPVEERLPEESMNSVIGWDEYRDRCCFVQYINGRWVLGNDNESVKIVAWQPLPEPYRPEKQR